MLLLPVLFDKDYEVRPLFCGDQHLRTSPFGSLLVRNRSQCCRPPSSAVTQKNSGSTTIDKDQFQVNLNVQQFLPEEIAIKVVGDTTITVEGKHEEKQDEHGFFSRHFIRKYVLPDGYDINNVTSSLSSDGVLSITAPRIEQGSNDHRTIPIQQTGISSKSVASETKGDQISQNDN